MPGSKNPSEDRGREVIRSSSQYLGHGMALALSVALFGWVGSEIGARVGFQPLLTLLGMLLGGAAGFYSIYLQLVVRPRTERNFEGSEKD